MGFVSDFAVKVLDAGVVARNPNVARSMAEEARLLSQLDHPNIVKVIDFKSLDHHVLGAVYFMVMEFVRGVDVSDLLHRITEAGRSVPATAVLHMGLMVSDALSHAHALRDRHGQPLGLVHRDLKPQNLMVNFRGQVKVLDFGIAKAKAHRLAAETQEGQTKGTVFYMSPEQLAGEALDGRSDLYSLGTILYELLLGRRLLDVEVNNPADLARAMHQAFDLDIDRRLGVLRTHLDRGAAGELPPEAVEGWLALLRALLQKDARYRPDSAKVLSQQLEWLRARHPPSEQRDFWVQQVEGAAQARPAVPRETFVESVDDLPAAPQRGLGTNTREFFGMDGADAVEEETLPYVAARGVPETTRTMSSVSGAVRVFGSAQMQQIGPLPQLIEQIRHREGASTLGLMTDEPGAAAHRSPTLEPPAVPRRGSPEAPTPVLGVSAVAVPPAAVLPQPANPARPLPTAILQQGRTSSDLYAEPSLKPSRTRRKAPPDQRVVFAVVLGVVGLALVLLALILRRGDDGAPIAEPAPPAAAPKVVPSAPLSAPPSLPVAPAPAPTAVAAPPVAEASAPPSAPSPPPRAERAANVGAPAPSTRTPPELAPAPAEPTPAPAAAPVAAAPETGTLHVSARPRCRVEIDGKAVGTTDETRRGVSLPVGTYSVRFVCDDEGECAKFKRRSAKKTLVVEAGKSNFFTADLYELNAGSAP
jgi:predicted Ser/Thr protein kinase